MKSFWRRIWNERARESGPYGTNELKFSANMRFAEGAQIQMSIARRRKKRKIDGQTIERDGQKEGQNIDYMKYKQCFTFPSVDSVN